MSLNGCQPSVPDTWAWTKQLSPCWSEKTHRYGGRSRSKASVAEHKDILIRLSAAAWSFIKMPEQPSPNTPPFLDMNVTGLWDQQEGTQQGWCCLSLVATSTWSASKYFELCPYCDHAEKSWYLAFSQQLVNICQMLITAVFLYSTSRRSLFNQAPRGGLWHPMLIEYELRTQGLSLLLLMTQFISCLFKTRWREKNFNTEHLWIFPRKEALKANWNFLFARLLAKKNMYFQINLVKGCSCFRSVALSAFTCLTMQNSDNLHWSFREPKLCHGTRFSRLVITIVQEFIVLSIFS